jgi:hypothetical protein
VTHNLVETKLGGHELLCPSAPGSLDDSVLIGVVTSHPEGPRMVPTENALPVTPEILKMAEPVSPSEVFRFASSCRGGKCPHFKNEECQLAVRSVVLLEAVADNLPKCPIRSLCRWFRQEGPEICKRCPQIITDQFKPYDQMIQIVYGTDPPPANTVAPPENATEGSLP